MSQYKNGLDVIQEVCGNDQEKVISLFTVAIKKGDQGHCMPCTRDVCAFYENGSLYISTSQKSRKIQQITNNPEVAFSVVMESISGNGIAKNLGWVKDPKNEHIRMKMHKIFADWFFTDNNEDDEDSIVLQIEIKKCTIAREGGRIFHELDLREETDTRETRII